MLKSIDNYLFEPKSSIDLNVFRAIYYGWFAVFTFSWYDFAGWAGTREDLYAPVWILDFLAIPILSFEALLFLSWLWKASLFFCAVGLFTKYAKWVAVVLGFYLLPLTQSFGRVDRRVALFAIGLLVLACCRSLGERFSVDSLLASRKGQRTYGDESYNLWGLRCIQLMTVIMIFSAGVVKWMRSGWDWVSSNTLISYFAFSNTEPGYAPYGPAPVDWGLDLAQMPTVTLVLGAMTIIIETVFPLVLFSKWARIILVGSFFGSLFVFNLILGPPILMYTGGLYFAWVPWENLGEAYRTRNIMLLLK
ncbi:MAG: hypothetical protein HRT45_01095 [Bdellovibrionales bacterium]|nr:hypothetical protein [Bdellovibrionales bacterium]